MSVDVLIPWRPGCPHRERAIEWVVDRYTAAGWNVLIGEHSSGPWCKAAAVDDALTGSTADVIAICDADVWCDRFEAAVSAVHAGAPWAIPHHLVHRYSENATANLIGGGEPAGFAEDPYIGHEGGGIVIVPRATYDDCPLDPRFLGWGGEDDSWAYALRTLHGAPWRGTADLIHLWHPPQARESRQVGSQANRSLYRRYCAAARKREAMRLLVNEMEHL